MLKHYNKGITRRFNNNNNNHKEQIQEIKCESRSYANPKYSLPAVIAVYSRCLRVS